MPGLPSSGGTVALGILVGLLSTCIQSVGLTLQRKSHLLEEERIELEDSGYISRPPYRRRRWQVGMLMFLIANIVGSTIQITTLPLPVLSTLQASGLVFNTACATILLKEPFTRYSVIGTSLVAAGAVLIALFGAMSEPSHNLDQLLMLLGQREFILWLSGTFFVAACILAAVWSQDHINVQLPSRISRSNTQLSQIQLQSQTSIRHLLSGLAYGSVSGVLSAHTLLLAKSAVELLVRTIVDRINQFDRWQSWIILLGLVALALAQLYFLHHGLKLCSTSVLYPFVFCIYNIVAILDGLIYFRQTSRLPASHAVLIALGTVILLAGVFALSWRLDPEYVPQDRLGMTSAPGSPVDTKHTTTAAARVLTPGSALAPGLGLVEQEAAGLGNDEDEDEQQESLIMSRKRKPLLQHRSTTPGEVTPLLRSRTEPVGANQKSSKSTVDFQLPTQSPHSPLANHSPFGGSQRIRNPRIRRHTAIVASGSPSASRVSLDAVNEADQSGLWDELENDAGNDARNFSAAGNVMRSPTLRRSDSGGKMTMSLRRARIRSANSRVWGSLVERAENASGTIKSSLKGLGWTGTESSYGTLGTSDGPEQSHGGEGNEQIEENQVGTVRRYPGRNRVPDSNGGWFRMDKWEWWRRSWKGNHGEGEEHEDGDEV